MLDSLPTHLHDSKKVAPSSQSARKPSATPPRRRSRAATDTTKAVQLYLGDSIPSSPDNGEHRKWRRQQDVKESLIRLTGCTSKLKYIGDDHECFELDSVKKFCTDYAIDLEGNPWKNFKRLLSGYQDLPFIILQNPTNAHIYEYEEMKKCPTLQWISEVLAEIGLALEDIVIIDICSLLSEDDLKRMASQSSDGPQRKDEAVERSYGMVEDILKFLKPSVVVSCQCATMGTRERPTSGGAVERTWEPAKNMLASCLCSREYQAKRGWTKNIRIGTDYSLMVYAVHPRRLCFEQSMIPVLRGIFKDVFEPCMAWFKSNKGNGQGFDGGETQQSKKVRSKPVVALQEKTGFKKSPKMVVTEVDEDETELGEQLSALKLKDDD
ncbi:hypothetical protein KVR01_012070 [Diaporthe batatas]|uniref:uncharacterized protein n=1 Tax=Diaporthe batatas TaxID=748121 RepID=UPI001D03B29A|nr:uncharacterized protein KVR01_012070 [Diaporthe batatas]KAG8158309.1 hypothetical protein KVR01_012070 [Diaporthe batatas]